MSAGTIAEQVKRQGSQGAKVAQCVVCKGDIQPFAGRPVSLYGKRYAHHPSQCVEVAERDVKLREMAGQGELFAWQCRHVEPAADMPVVCDEVGDGRDAFVRHMRGHGAAVLREYRPVRLRKGAPAASLPKLEVNPFKFIRWHEVRYGAWQAGIGNPVIGEADRRGQFWSEGSQPHSVWVVPLEAAPWEAPGTVKPVELFSHGDSTWSADWSRAKSDRREASRRSKRNAA